MHEPFALFVALAGACVLGYVLALTLQKGKYSSIEYQKLDLEQKLNEVQHLSNKLQAELNGHETAFNALREAKQLVENQSLEKESELALLKAENKRLADELHYLSENPIEKIKEIDVVREVPIVVFKEITVPESRKDKAKKLMMAFKKGYLDEMGLLQTSEPRRDQEVE